MKKKRARLTVETERLLVFSRSRRVVDRWCPECRADVKMIGIDEAAAVSGVGQRMVFLLAEVGKIHFVETVEGQALFCVNSLSRQRCKGGHQSLPD